MATSVITVVLYILNSFLIPYFHVSVIQTGESKLVLCVTRVDTFLNIGGLSKDDNKDVKLKGILK